ncbi:hypothetical protein FANTH_681 [Fusarium anthophilum]|uniref:NADH:flavin oxidoreductase/NADH oxidase N-terminal domain-containing protein n=1 Tax=Fusarium anthophilum TaxID=48485 RepID=A0A8H4ZX52_9HYPO|nr:hypothetical protein FANTH_681 [Fusarium anthophilum]
MCQYSAHDGLHTPWHVAHYGGMAVRGLYPGLMMIVATAVQANGRITPEDSGLWLDAHMETTRPSSQPFSDKYSVPRSMSLQEIDQLKKDFNAAAIRAVDTGFDVIELHFAHGYLKSSFLSPAVNKRSDQYGGGSESRTSLAIELVQETRKVFPEKTPLFTCNNDIRLAQILAQEGVNEPDVSSGDNHHAQKVQGRPGYQEKFTKAITHAVCYNILVSTVRSIESDTQAQEIIAQGQEVDLVAAGRIFQKNPGLVWAWADDLGVDIQVTRSDGALRAEQRRNKGMSS